MSGEIREMFERKVAKLSSKEQVNHSVLQIRSVPQTLTTQGLRNLLTSCQVVNVEMRGSERTNMGPGCCGTKRMLVTFPSDVHAYRAMKIVNGTPPFFMRASIQPSDPFQINQRRIGEMGSQLIQAMPEEEEEEEDWFVSEERERTERDKIEDFVETCLAEESDESDVEIQVNRATEVSSNMSKADTGNVDSCNQIEANLEGSMNPREASSECCKNTREGSPEVSVNSGTLEDSPEGSVNPLKDSPECCMNPLEDSPEGSMNPLKDSPKGSNNSLKDGPEDSINPLESFPEGSINLLDDSPEDSINPLESIPEGSINLSEASPEGCINPAEATSEDNMNQVEVNLVSSNHVVAQNVVSLNLEEAILEVRVRSTGNDKVMGATVEGSPDRTECPQDSTELIEDFPDSRMNLFEISSEGGSAEDGRCQISGSARQDFHVNKNPENGIFQEERRDSSATAIAEEVKVADGEFETMTIENKLASEQTDVRSEKLGSVDGACGILMNEKSVASSILNIRVFMQKNASPLGKIKREEVEPLILCDPSAELGTMCLVQAASGRLLHGRLLGWQVDRRAAEVQLRDYPVRYLAPANLIFKPPLAQPLAINSNVGTRRQPALDDPVLTWILNSHVSLTMDKEKIEINIGDLNHVAIRPGQQCFFLELGESGSQMAYIKPIGGEEVDEEAGEDQLLELERLMLEAWTMPFYSRPPPKERVVAVPRRFNGSLKYIRGEVVAVYLDREDVKVRGLDYTYRGMHGCSSLRYLPEMAASLPVQTRLVKLEDVDAVPRHLAKQRLSKLLDQLPLYPLLLHSIAIPVGDDPMEVHLRTTTAGHLIMPAHSSVNHAIQAALQVGQTKDTPTVAEYSSLEKLADRSSQLQPAPSFRPDADPSNWNKLNIESLLVNSKDLVVARFLASQPEQVVALPTGQVLGAVVLHVASPLAVYLTPFTTDINIKSLAKELSALAARSSPVVGEPILGQVYLTQSAVDKEWSRVLCVKLYSSRKVGVYHLDGGFMKKCQASELRNYQISKEPFLGHHCLLAKWVGRPYTNLDVKELRQHLPTFSEINVAVISRIGGSFIVDLCSDLP